MAGSYEHCINDDETFRDNESFIDMIENLGDAYEACEQMHWMINYLSGGDKAKINKAIKEFYKKD